MKYLYLPFIISFLFLSIVSLFLMPKQASAQNETPPSLWDVQCVDTMKTSRDKAREWMKNVTSDVYIEKQIRSIKNAGADCVAISTPYDDEFLPMLSKWVAYAREYNLKVWFRGNFSGWEGWFDYKKLSAPSEHHTKTYNFITENSTLFKTGDIFTPVPEPENGLMGDPRAKKNGAQFNAFLVTSYRNCQDAFKKIGVVVNCGYFSMNGDVAKEILTKETVQKTGNVVVIDHYVKNASKMKADIIYLAEKFHAPIVLGEYGAPIPDINGTMTEDEQAGFIAQMLHTFYEQKKYIKGINYWTLYDGTTALLRSDYSEKKVIATLKDFYKPVQLTGRVVDTLGSPLNKITVKQKMGSVVMKQMKKENIHW